MVCYNNYMAKMLLLSCCAPCSCGVIKKLSREGRDFAVLFYNPNIAPEDEYKKRLAENKRLCDVFKVPFYDLEYQPALWAEAIKGCEKDAERGERCFRCFLMRLRRAAVFAKHNGFDTFSSVLGVSRHKDMDQVNKAGLMAGELEGIPYDTFNWRKGGLEELRRAVNKELTLYNQNYCGCPYSKRNKDIE